MTSVYSNSGCGWVLLGAFFLGSFACSGDTVGSNNQNNSQPGVCGDGVMDGAEFCDGADLGGASCVNLGFGGGLLSCDADCNFVNTGCEAMPFCGDGVVDASEVCDDANTVGGDGCSANCLSTEVCLNGLLDPLTNESCDDGNGVDWDGCNAVCECVEFQVNTYATDDQYAPRIARAADGSFVVVWLSDGQDGSEKGIYAQRFDAAGNPLGAEFQVNTYTSLNQVGPRIAMAPDGRFVLEWISLDQDGSGYGVYFQRYSSAGVPQGVETQVNTTTSGSQNGAAVGMAADGSFVVLFQSDPTDYDIYFRRYDANGVALSAETLVNSYTAGHQAAAHLDLMPTGAFVIVWHSELQDGDGWGVFGQRFNATGTAVGMEFQVNSSGTGDQRRPDVAMADDGSFMAVWTHGSLVTDTWDVFGRRFDIAGIPVGPEFQINAFTSSSDIYPYIDMVGDGRSIVTWPGPDSDGDGYGAYARYFGSNGTALGPEFLLNLYTAGGQSWPFAALNDDGSAWIVWHSEYQDGSLKGVFGRRFDSSGVGLCRGL